MVTNRETTASVADDAYRDKPLVVACIPAYNEESSIAGVIVKAQDYVDEVLVCDDGSTDLTGAISEKLGAKVLRHEGNLGYGSSLRNMFQEALAMGADVIVTFDGDGQHDPGQIPTLVNALCDADIVVGSRFLDGGNSETPGWRENGIKMITNLATDKDLGLTDAQSGFRAYNRNAVKALSLTEDGMGVSTEILVKAQDAGLGIAEVPINIKYGEDTSTHNPLVHGMGVIVSTFKHLSLRRPLLFYGLPGFISLCAAVFFWGWSLKIFTRTRTISTNVALIALTGTIVGLMLMTTSIILWVVISVIKEKR